MVCPLCRVKGVCVFRCNLPPALLAEWPGSFTCHCGNAGLERTPNKSQHTKLTLEKIILPPLLPGFELAIFRSRVWRSNQQAIPAVKTPVSVGQYAHWWVSDNMPIDDGLSHLTKSTLFHFATFWSARYSFHKDWTSLRVNRWHGSTVHV